MLTQGEITRYDRQLRLAGFGPEAQARLSRGSVLVIGAGGLGSPAILYLAAAGGGRVGVVDDDVVELSNLHRQVIHRQADVGVAKVASAARAVADANPTTVFAAHPERLTEANVSALIADYDVIVDGSDNFATRYLLNDAAYLAGKPLVHGSVLGFEGQLTVFRPGGPCYRCLYPNPPAAGTMPSCSEAGVLGVLPGVIGVLQATEAIKLLAGVGVPAAGRLVTFDGLRLEFGEFRYGPDPACPLCADLRVTGAAEPRAAGAAELHAQVHSPGRVRTLTAAEYARLSETGEAHLLLDVRDEWELASGSIAGCVNVPLTGLSARLDELAGWRETLVVCYCQWGGRSLWAAELLAGAGFTDVANLAGGWQAFSARG